MVKRAMHHSPVWLVVPLWALFVGIVFGRVGILIYDHHYFLAHMRETQGVVLKKISHPADHFSTQDVYGLLYRYTAGNVVGRTFTQVDPPTFERAEVGGPLPIAYLPEDPHIHYIDYPWEIEDEAWVPLDDFAVGMAVFVPGLFLIGYFGWRNRIHAQLMKSGTAATGEVIAVRKTHTRHGSYNYLTFRFTTRDGHAIDGRTASLPRNARTHWQVGDPVPVVYDPQRPTRFAVDTDHPLDILLLEQPPDPAPVAATIWS